MAKAKQAKVFNKYLDSEVLTTAEPTLVVNYLHYELKEGKTISFVVNSKSMDKLSKTEFLSAIKKRLDTNTEFAMYNLKLRQEMEQLISAYDLGQELDEEADELFKA